MNNNDNPFARHTETRHLWNIIANAMNYGGEYTEAWAHAQGEFIGIDTFTIDMVIDFMIDADVVRATVLEGERGFVPGLVAA